MQFSLRNLLLLVSGCSLIAAAAHWHPLAAVFVRPAIIGPYAAFTLYPTRASVFVGLIAAYFWSIVLAIPLAMPGIYLLAYADIKPPIVVFAFAVLCSLLGGFLAARVERSRVDHQARRQNVRIRR